MSVSRPGPNEVGPTSAAVRDMVAQDLDEILKLDWCELVLL